MNQNFNNYRNNNRNFGGPIVPFVLGGIVGSIWSNNNRYYPYPVYPMPYYPYPYYPYNRLY